MRETLQLLTKERQLSLINSDDTVPFHEVLAVADATNKAMLGFNPKVHEEGLRPLELDWREMPLVNHEHTRNIMLSLFLDHYFQGKHVQAAPLAWVLAGYQLLEETPMNWDIDSVPTPTHDLTVGNAYAPGFRQGRILRAADPRIATGSSEVLFTTVTGLAGFVGAVGLLRLTQTEKLHHVR